VVEQGHGGTAVVRALQELGVDHLFTLTGGHIFPILDGAHQLGVRIVDVRHEQTAGFAAEGWARLTRKLGVAAITAGPGVTNAMSAIAQAGFNGAPVLALAGRAPSFRWGQGSLQEIDHVPFVEPLAPSHTVMDTSAIAKEVIAAAQDALTPPRGPRFLDFPLDVLFNNAEFEIEIASPEAPPEPDSDAVMTLARLIATSERPVLVAGSNVWLDDAEGQLRKFAEKVQLPVIANGQGRGLLPPDHPLAFARARSTAFKDADLVIVAGTSMDFRLGFGQFANAKVVHLDSHASSIAQHVDLAAGIGARLDLTFAALDDASDRVKERGEWIDRLRSVEEEKRAAAEGELRSDASPIHPMRIYGELAEVLDPSAIVIGDGGDFVSYAGREIPVREPGTWLDPGPFGCLGCGPGYAIAARCAYPERQVALLYGDGALGFAGMELETFVRLGLPVVAVVGNNGIWGLEKHPMQALYGYDVAAELRPGIRYDQVMEALGGRGELVTEPDEIGPALRRAFDSGEPTLVNILTDPAIAYPRSANLA
jgi:acetolactate synthase I/II/III large subunit